MDKNKIIYIGILLIVTVLISVTYFSYAFFTSRIEQHGKLNIVAGTLDYQIESNDLVNNSIVLESNESKTINIKITSLNDIKSKYELYYTTTNDNIRIGYSNDKDVPVDTIDKNASKDIVITIKNNSDSSTTVTFGVEGGLINNQLVLANGNSINDIINPVVISLNTNGGSIVSNKIYLLSGDTIGILPEPIYENKIFDGWYLESTFENKVTTETVFNEDTTLYAKWSENIFNYYGRSQAYPSNSNLSNTTKRTWTENTYVTGIADDNYYMGGTSRVSSYSITPTRITVTSGCGYGIVFPMLLNPNHTYRYTQDSTSTTTPSLVFYASDGTYIGGNGGIIPNKDFTIPNNVHWTLISIKENGSCDRNATAYVDNPRLFIIE